MEAHSDHPLARAILEFAKARGIAFTPAEDFRVLLGKGATARFDGRQFWLGSHRFLEERGVEHFTYRSAVFGRIQNRYHGTLLLLVPADTAQRSRFEVSAPSEDHEDLPILQFEPLPPDRQLFVSNYSAGKRP